MWSICWNSKINQTKKKTSFLNTKIIVIKFLKLFFTIERRRIIKINDNEIFLQTTKNRKIYQKFQKIKFYVYEKTLSKMKMNKKKI